MSFLKDFLKSEFEKQGLDTTNEAFIQALEIGLYSDRSMFLTGRAGTGKTTFLHTFTRLNQTKNMAVIAPTGVAAINAKGRTIHSFFRIDPRQLFLPGDARLQPSAKNKKESIFSTFQFTKSRLEVIKKLDVLIIDEISMVRVEMLDIIDQILRVFRRKMHLPFGGVQLILIGDPFQLPPIVREQDWNLLSPYYQSRFFFSSHAFQQLRPFHLELEKIYRQKDFRFKELLNRIRESQHTPADLALLNQTCAQYDFSLLDKGYILLGTHNQSILEVNSRKLAELPGEPKVYKAELKDDFPSNMAPFDPIDLTLKVGAQVIFMRNNPESKFYNGMLGKVVKMDEKTIQVEDVKGFQYEVHREVWENVEFKYNEKKERVESEVIGSFVQFPLKLAWAITVHKSQGLTFERCVLDIGRSFEAGQVYVALSRCTSLEGLVLKSKIAMESVKVSADSLTFSAQRSHTDEIEEELERVRALVGLRHAFRAFRTGNYRLAEQFFQEAQQVEDFRQYPKWRQFLRLQDRLMDRADRQKRG
ncbi:MAG TPA: DEAD/DEAH box helicase [Lunatimonas sp.]|nr:DEAD/DEAH box helicase [Lunatimonas sp.]